MRYNLKFIFYCLYCFATHFIYLIQLKCLIFFLLNMNIICYDEQRKSQSVFFNYNMYSFIKNNLICKKKTHRQILKIKVLLDLLTNISELILSVSVKLVLLPCFYVCAQSVSPVQLFVTPWTVAHQTPLYMGFSRQEYCSGLPFLLQGIFPTQGLNLPCLHRAL